MPTKRSEFVQTIRCQQLGARMRELRDDRGLTLKYVAAYLGVEFSTLARYERAEWPFRADHVEQVINMYGVHDAREREELLALAANANRAHHWYRDGVEPAAKDGPMPDRWWIHDRADHAFVYSPSMLPWLVQTVSYREQVLRQAVRLPEPGKQPEPTHRLERYEYGLQKRIHDIEARVRALTSDKEPRLLMVVDERVLRRPIAGVKAQKAQLEHLANLVRRYSHIDLQVIPEQGPAHPGVLGGFTVYRMPPPYPEVVLLDHLGGSLLIEADGVDVYLKAFTSLTQIAATPLDSLALLDEIKEEL